MNSILRDIIEACGYQYQVPVRRAAAELGPREDGVAVVLDLVEFLASDGDIGCLEFDDQVTDPVMFLVLGCQMEVDAAGLSVPALDGGGVFGGKALEPQVGAEEFGEPSLAAHEMVS